MNDDTSEFESALRGLVPQVAQLDRDGLMYSAGIEAERPRARRSTRVAMGIASLSTAAAIAFAVLLIDSRAATSRLEAALRLREERGDPATVHVAEEGPSDGKSSPRSPLKDAIASAPPIDQVDEPGPAGASRQDQARSATSDRDVAGRSPSGTTYAELRALAMAGGADALTDPDRRSPPSGSADHPAPPATNRELRKLYLDRPVRQSSGFESLLRSLPLFEGERS